MMKPETGAEIERRRVRNYFRTGFSCDDVDDLDRPWYVATP